MRKDKSLSEADYARFTTDLGNLTNFTTHDPNFSPENFRSILQKCKKIHNINICNSVRLLSNNALGAIAELCPNIVILNLTHLQLAQESEILQLANACKQLSFIRWLGDGHYYNRNLFQFAWNCPMRLQVVNFRHMVFEGPELYQLALRNTYLRELHLRECVLQQFPSELLIAILQLSTQLHVVNVGSCAWITDACIRALVHCRQLRSLRCDRIPNLTAATIVSILPSLPLLEELDARDSCSCHNSTIILTAAAANCPRLVTLKLKDKCVNQEDLDMFTSRGTNITTLNLFFSSSSYSLNCTQLQGLRQLELYSKRTFKSEDILHIVKHCPKLTHLTVCARYNAWMNQEIVLAIAENCLVLRKLTFDRCSKKVHDLLIQLQLDRARLKQKLKMTVLLVFSNTSVVGWIIQHI